MEVRMSSGELMGTDEVVGVLVEVIEDDVAPVSALSYMKIPV